MPSRPVASHTSKPKTEQANFRLPSPLVDLIRGEAAKRRVPPAHVVADRLRRSFETDPAKLPTFLEV